MSLMGWINLWQQMHIRMSHSVLRSAFTDSGHCFSFCLHYHQWSLLGFWVNRKDSRGKQTTYSRISLSQGLLEKSQPTEVPRTVGSAFKVTERSGWYPTSPSPLKDCKNGVGTQWLEKGNWCNYIQTNKQKEPKNYWLIS